MKTKQYRIKAYDPVNDIYLLQEKFLFIFWRTISVGTEEEIKQFIMEDN